MKMVRLNRPAAAVNAGAFVVADLERIDNADRFTDIHGPLFRIERRIGGKQHAVDPEKIEPALGSRERTKQRRVGVEKLESLERPSLE